MYIEDPRITVMRNIRTIFDEYRKQTGHGYRYIAEGCKMRKSTMRDLRLGKQAPTYETLWKLAQFFELPVEYFFRR